MRANERLVANDGYEVLLFPLEYLYMSQDEGGSYSHLYTYSIDLLGWGANGRKLKCPYYAPCTCKCVQRGTGSVVWESVNKVHFADGTLDYVTFHFAHDDNTSNHYVGQLIQQGNLIGHTGTTGNVTGDHLHLNTARGHYAGFYDVGTGHYQLVNSTHVYDTMYVNDTTILQGYGHNWRTYSGGHTPVEPKKYKFKWVLYANKLREKMST